MICKEIRDYSVGTLAIAAITLFFYVDYSLVYSLPSIPAQIIIGKGRIEKKPQFSWLGFLFPQLNAKEMDHKSRMRVDAEKGPSITEREFVIVKSQNGLVNTKDTRILFFKDNWYEQFLAIRNELSKTMNKPDSELHAWYTQSNGYTKGFLAKNYAIFSNLCISPRAKMVYLHEKEPHLQDASIEATGAKDFYFNPVTVENSPVPASQLVKQRLGLFVVHPRQYSNIFHFLEGESMILHVALHPELYPKMKRLFTYGQLREDDSTWTGFVQSLLLDGFSEKNRPEVVDRRDTTVFPSTENTCDEYMVLLRSWDDDGTGHFVNEYLGADMLRAAAYKRANISLVRKGSGEKLNLLIINRQHNRKILNFNELTEKVHNEFDAQFSVKNYNLEMLSPLEHVQQFANLDILVATHGAGITNIIFMLPDSHLIELFPPFWYFGCYRKLAENMEVSYSKVNAVGEKGPECNENPYSQSCQIKGIRDRDFYVNVDEVISSINEITSLLWKNKYDV